jgi:hypothetical protein
LSRNPDESGGGRSSFFSRMLPPVEHLHRRKNPLFAFGDGSYERILGCQVPSVATHCTRRAYRGAVSTGRGGCSGTLARPYILAVVFGIIVIVARLLR